MGRVVLPNYPHHVVQRGHNRQVVFAEPADFEYDLETLAEFKAEYAIKVYGFCLMANHVHLVLEAGERVAGLGQLMKRFWGATDAVHESPRTAERYVVGEPLQVKPHPDRGVSVSLLSIR